MNIKSFLFHRRRILIDRHLSSFVKSLSSSQLLSEDELYNLNWERKKSLVNFAFNSIPYYRKKYLEVGFEIGDLKSNTDFERLPILEKDEIRLFENDLVNPLYDKGKLQSVTTGGSTGKPLKTYSDPRYPLHAVSWRTLNWWGVEPYDNSGYLYRAIPEGFTKFLQKIMLFPTRRSYISASKMSPENMQLFYLELLYINPKYIVGYVGAIEIFASFLASNQYHIPSLEAIWTTAAPLTPSKRTYMQDIFDCNVYTQYGSCEFYWIASECKEQSGLHIASDIRSVEIVNGDTPEKMESYGDIIVTDLINYAFPLIRYRIGDRGRLFNRKCSCQLPFPMMDYVKGRVSDTIYFPNGLAIPGEYWTTIFDDFPSSVKSFQVIQNKDYSIDIHFEPYDNEYEDVIDSVRNVLYEKMGKVVPITFKKSMINVNQNGKTHFVISHLNNKY